MLCPFTPNSGKSKPFLSLCATQSSWHFHFAFFAFRWPEQLLLSFLFLGFLLLLLHNQIPSNGNSWAIYQFCFASFVAIRIFSLLKIEQLWCVFFAFGTRWRSVYFQLALFFLVQPFHFVLRANCWFGSNITIIFDSKNCRHKVVAWIALCVQWIRYLKPLLWWCSTQMKKNKIFGRSIIVVCASVSSTQYTAYFTLNRTATTVNRSNIFRFSLALDLAHLSPTRRKTATLAK